MASVVVLIADLMFGSRVRESLTAAGHDVSLSSAAADARARAASADVLVLDLDDGTLGAAELVEAMSGAGELAGTRTLGFYSHVDVDTRRRGERAGVELVVPRSRMAREAAELVAALT